MKDENLERLPDKIERLQTSEEKFIAAKNSKLIKFASVEEIRQALRYALIKIGLREDNWPEGPAKFLLLQHVWENFTGNTLDDIRLAFDWAIEGRLDEDVNCFENFSCLYFTRIMRSYNRLACKVRDEKKEQRKYLPEAKKEEPVIEDPEAYEKFLQTGFAQILKGKGIEIPKF